MRFPLFAALVCRISRQKKTAKIWVSFPSVREWLARCIVVQKPAFYYAFARCFLRRAGSFCVPFWAKKDGYFSASPCLLTACVFRAWTCLGAVRGMLGMPGMLGMLMLGLHLLFEEPVSRCSFALIELFPGVSTDPFFVRAMASKRQLNLRRLFWMLLALGVHWLSLSVCGRLLLQ